MSMTKQNDSTTQNQVSPGFSGTKLRIIAMLSMFADHVAVIFVSPEKMAGLYLLLRFVGRLSFMIFAFLLVVGFMHTKNVRNYILRMMLLAFLSEIPFDLALQGSVMEFGKQNVVYTLCIGLIMLAAIRHFGDSTKAFIGFGMLACFVAILIGSDYSYIGILLILFYYFDNFDKAGRIFSLIFLNVSTGDFIQGVGGSSAIFFTEHYDGSPSALPKWFCYLFYPGHLLLLWGLHTLLF